MKNVIDGEIEMKFYKVAYYSDDHSDENRIWFSSLQQAKKFFIAFKKENKRTPDQIEEQPAAMISEVTLTAYTFTPNKNGFLRLLNKLNYGWQDTDSKEPVLTSEVLRHDFD